jgi:putative transposase
MKYQSDLTDSQWELIAPLLGKPGNKSKYDKRELINAVLYLVKTGCQWRLLPHDFPDWQAVYKFYQRSRRSGLWDKILRFMVAKTRVAKGKSENPTYALIDSQSVKTTSASDDRGFDGGKKRKVASDIS